MSDVYDARQLNTFNEPVTSSIHKKRNQNECCFIKTRILTSFAQETVFLIYVQYVFLSCVCIMKTSIMIFDENSTLFKHVHACKYVLMVVLVVCAVHTVIGPFSRTTSRKNMRS